MLAKLKSPFLQISSTLLICIIGLLILSTLKLNVEMLVIYATIVFGIYIIGNLSTAVFSDDFWVYILKSFASIISFLALFKLFLSIFINIFSLTGSSQAKVMFFFMVYYPGGIIISFAVRYFLQKKGKMSSEQDQC
ncbi:MAG: hypothetical protein OEZ22_03890 [Spirochaetia bacterium]|nr:hypothetical protein [Spirochaetia bacterium]